MMIKIICTEILSKCDVSVKNCESFLELPKKPKPQFTNLLYQILLHVISKTGIWRGRRDAWLFFGVNLIEQLPHSKFKKQKISAN